MEDIPVLKIVSLIILLLLSAFFSSAETALSTSSRVRLKAQADEGSKAAALSVRLLDKYSRVISSILIGNNVANIAASSIMTLIAVQISFSVSMATGILTVVILLFSEIIPKNISRIAPDKLIKIYAPFLNFLMIILMPFAWLISFVEKGVMKLLRVDPNYKPPMTEAELRAYIEMSHNDEVIEDDEREIIENAIEFGDKPVSDVMTPRTDIVAVGVDDTYDAVKDKYKDSMYTRMPVYDGDIDNIIGTLNVKDLAFTSPQEFDIKNTLQPALLTHEGRRLKNLLKDMRRDNTPAAYVIDEYGALAGMVTMEDILTEIVGEMGDEYNSEDDIVILSEGTYKVDGGVSLGDLKETIGIELDAGDYNSVGGFIINALDRLPMDGDVIEKDGVRCTVDKTDGNRVASVILEVINKTDSNAG